jgi:phage/plasmid-like protein (TIGR03299 family)
MSANLDQSNGRYNIAFLGSRKSVWHHNGQEMLSGQTIEQWAVAAGLNFKVIKVPAIAALTGPEFDHIDADKRFTKVDDRAFNVRQDTGAVLGYVSGEHANVGYQTVQPLDVLEWFDRYIKVDERFELDVAGSLNGGRQIWATALYRDPLTVCGESHKARLLMSTTFDGTGATKNQGTITRVVCENTIRQAHSDTRAVINTRHSTKFDAAKVGKELAQLAQSYSTFKAIGDAMGRVEFAKDQVSDFFKDCLDIDRTAKREDISTRKANQFIELGNAYKRSVAEGAPKETVWAALQAITRYVDHDRSVKTGGGKEEVARFASAQFGSGDALKGKAMGLLLPLVKDKVLIAA